VSRSLHQSVAGSVGSAHTFESNISAVKGVAASRTQLAGGTLQVTGRIGRSAAASSGSCRVASRTRSSWRSSLLGFRVRSYLECRPSTQRRVIPAFGTREECVRPIDPSVAVEIRKVRDTSTVRKRGRRRGVSWSGSSQCSLCERTRPLGSRPSPGKPCRNRESAQVRAILRGGTDRRFWCA